MPTRSEVIAARRKAVGGRRPRCRKGKSCSAACINRNKLCLADAPMPVTGALPKAIKAIQTRREKLGRKEKAEVSEKRKTYAKGKRREYLKRELLDKGIKLTTLAQKGDKESYDKLEKGFLKLLDQYRSLGGDSKVSKESIWELYKNDREVRTLFEGYKKMIEKLGLRIKSR